MQSDCREDIFWLNEVLQFLQQGILDRHEDNLSVAVDNLEFVQAFCREVYQRAAPQYPYQGKIVLSLRRVAA